MPEPLSCSLEFEDKALAWVVREDRGLTPSERSEMEAWLAASPAHRKSYARFTQDWGKLDCLRCLEGDPRWAAPRGRFRRLRPSLKRAVPWLALPVAAMLAFGLLPRNNLTQQPGGPSVVRQSPVLNESTWLEDGSHAILEPGACVELQYTAGERGLRLVRGCATFQVRKDPSRPFVVEAGGLRFRALGTVFQIREQGEGVELRVSEGRVGIGGLGFVGDQVPVLVAGECARLTPGIRAADIVRSPLGSVEARVMSGSGEGSLEFDQVPLSEVADILTKRGPYRVRIADEACGKVRVVASLRPDGVPALAAMLCSDGRLWYKIDGYDLVVGSAAPVAGR